MLNWNQKCRDHDQIWQAYAENDKPIPKMLNSHQKFSADTKKYQPYVQTADIRLFHALSDRQKNMLMCTDLRRDVFMRTFSLSLFERSDLTLSFLSHPLEWSNIIMLYYYLTLAMIVRSKTTGEQTTEDWATISQGTHIRVLVLYRQRVM